MIREAIMKIVEEKKDLREEEAMMVMSEIMNGEATAAQIASFITALHCKGETPEEIAGCARVMREKSIRIKVPYPVVVDTCGTGGDGMSTFNISTTAAFVVAGAGIPVAKHGNRAVSSRCGSADLLLGLGIKIEIPPRRVEECLEEVGFGFLFAPLLHSAMKYALGPRREIGIPTVFNLLGPLTNPANAPVQLLGVFREDLTEVFAGVLKRLGSKHALVVHGCDGLDEITTTMETKISELVDGEIKIYYIRPEDFGLKRARLQELLGGGLEENVRIALQVLERKPGPSREVVLLNAGAAIYAAGKANDLKEGIEKAAESIDSGKALQVVEKLRKITGGSN